MARGQGLESVYYLSRSLAICRRNALVSSPGRRRISHELWADMTQEFFYQEIGKFRYLIKHKVIA